MATQNPAAAYLREPGGDIGADRAVAVVGIDEHQIEGPIRKQLGCSGAVCHNRNDLDLRGFGVVPERREDVILPR